MSWVDYSIVGAFLAAMALIGLRISKLIKSPGASCPHSSSPPRSPPRT